MKPTKTARSGHGSKHMLIHEKTIWTPDNSDLLKYREMARAGDVVIGQELQIELDNLAEDIATERFLYNTDDARIRMDFMENCIRLTKSPYYNKPMKLMEWQRALIESIYSFKMPDTEFRRFWYVLLLIARKNTKSETCSAMGCTEFFLGPAGADIVAASNDDAQASIVYDAIDTMRKLIDPRDRDSRRNQRFIRNLATDTKIFKLSDRTRNKEGRNIDISFLDESHEMKNNIIAKSIEQSQSLKPEPLFVNLTTEGFIFDGYLDDELKKCRKVIFCEDPDNPELIHRLPWLYTQDSEAEVWNGNRENRLWMKSNPTLGTIKKWEYMEAQVAAARESKSDRIFVLSKDFNIKQTAVQSWLNTEDYDYECGFDVERFRGSWALGAVDLAETTDLVCARALLMLPDDPRKFIMVHYFIPEGKLVENDDAAEGAKYQQWAQDGVLTITEGNDIDLSVVADWYYKLFTDYGIKLWKAGFDQKFAKDWLARMETLGWTRNGSDPDLVMILQNAETLSNAIKLAEADFKSRLIWYDANAYKGREMEQWNFRNACLKADEKGKCLIVKQKPAKKIDGAVCLAILYETYRRFRTDFREIIKNTASDEGNQ